MVDFSPIYDFFALPTDQMLLKSMYLFGWIPIAFVFLWGAKEVWLNYIQDKWGSGQKFILLAIDIPRGNAQSPKAVENIFTYLLGAHKTINFLEKYWEGVFQLSFSMEIVSINGYTQFLIHTPADFRNMVESAVYSQYPDAEITEVNDYTEEVPAKFPDEEYDLWGAEFIQAKNQAYPIKTYEDFIDSLGAPEELFKDPMASLMDLCSSLGNGEQLWYQIIITPIGFDLAGEGDREVSKILKEKTKGKQNIFDIIINGILAVLEEFSEAIFSLGGGAEQKKEENDDALKMMNLKPKEKKQIEKIQIKSAKAAFKFKSRFIYVAKKDVMNKPKAVNGFVGYLKQFADIDLNNLKPDMEMTATIAAYFFKESRVNSRKNKIIRNYINRSVLCGRTPGILNIEELASIWHFPIEAVVKAPLIQKAPGRKAEPPMSLPFGEEIPGESLIDSLKEDIFSESLKEEGLTEKNGKEKETVIDLTKIAGPVVKKAKKEEPDFDLDASETEDSKGVPPNNLPFAQ